jgi:IS4 transposase
MLEFKNGLQARLITYKDDESGKVLRFESNLFEYNALTIAQLYKYRWSIEVFFKRLKQSFQIDYFFSDSSNGIQTQIWIVLIANVLMSIIHRLTKQKECFTITVSMAACNMTNYTSLVAIICQERPSKKPKIRIVQLNLFSKTRGVLF